LEEVMRNLITNDIFKMSRILKKMSLKLDVKGKTSEEIGGEFVLAVLENIHLAQEEVNDFLGGLMGMEGESFGKLPIEQTMEAIAEFKNLPGLAGFFKAAGLSTK
jgi:hypothetical protein